MPRHITDKDCQATPKFKSAAPIMEYCAAWRKAAEKQLSDVNRTELESERLNPKKVQTRHLTPERLQRMRVRLNTLSGV